MTDEDPSRINQCDNEWLNERGGLKKIVDCIFYSLISKNGIYFNRKPSSHAERPSPLFVKFAIPFPEDSFP